MASTPDTRVELADGFSPAANALCKRMLNELNQAYADCIERHVGEMRAAEPEQPVAIGLAALCLCFVTQVIGAGSSDEDAVTNVVESLAFMRRCQAMGVISVQEKTFHEA